jgi:hypothetical protein
MKKNYSISPCMYQGKKINKKDETKVEKEPNSGMQNCSILKYE